MQLTITPLAEAGVEVLPPDIIWNRGTVGDFAISTTSADGGVGGLVARNPLRTAAIMLLFSDAPAEDWELRPEHGGDRRGWVGDGFDVDATRWETALGSKLWLYRRHELSDQTARDMADECMRALQPLVRSGAVASVMVTPAGIDAHRGQIRMKIDLFGRDGTKVYADEFDVLWRRADGL